ncbi:MAG: hypothetical protein QOH05_1598 [Acetobacteraceae bacterium]|nr:hypothetical protein [Acetobacteraceae bacterium]
MSSISAVSSVMTQAMMMKPPLSAATPPPGVPKGADSDGDSDMSGSAPSSSFSGKLINISA